MSQRTMLSTSLRQPFRLWADSPLSRIFGPIESGLFRPTVPTEHPEGWVQKQASYHQLLRGAPGSICKCLGLQQETDPVVYVAQEWVGEAFCFSTQCVSFFLQVLLLSRWRPQDTCTNMWPLLWTGGTQTDPVNNALLSCFLNPRTVSEVPSANCCSPTTSEVLSG